MPRLYTLAEVTTPVISTVAGPEKKKKDDSRWKIGSIHYPHIHNESNVLSLTGALQSVLGL